MKSRVATYLGAAVLALAIAAAPACHDTPDYPLESDRDFEFELAVDDKSGEVPPGTITTLNIKNFRISAFNSSNPHDLIMRNIEVTRDGFNSWTYSPAVEWPDYSIDFEAVTPSSEKIASFGSWDWGYPSTVILNTHHEGKIDFCVATSRQIHQQTGRIRLNFCHAMARVDIRLEADIPNASLVVKKIDFFNVCEESTFFFPKGSTYPRDEIGQLEGCWADWTQSNANDTIAFFISDSPEGLSVDTIMKSIGNQDNIFYIPHTFRPLMENNGYITGSGIRILCKVVSKATGKQIWPDKDTPYQLIPNQWAYKWAYMYFPLSDTSLPSDDYRNKWRPGYHYNYNIRIRKHGELPRRHTADGTRNAIIVDTSANTLEVTSLPY